MQFGVFKEPSFEPRISLTLEIAKKLKIFGELFIEKGLGDNLFFKDEDFQEVGAIPTDKKTVLSSDVILHLTKPSLEEISLMKSGAILISFLDPFFSKDILFALKERDITSLAIELMPRITIAQKMDALSSQANLAGYVSVLLAAERIGKILPMMTTPAGTIFPAKIFIIGVGVAGLSAIATAKRLGAKVLAFDTRPIVEEQVKSLGAKFLKIDLGKTSETKEGYALSLTEEQIKKQKEAMAEACSDSDIVITTAQVYGKKAPRLIDRSMIAGMKRGSLILDLAAETGGNVEGSSPEKEVSLNGIRILGCCQLARRVPLNASELYSANLYALVSHFWDKEKKIFSIDLENEILKSCIVTHKKRFISPKIQELFGKGE